MIYLCLLLIQPVNSLFFPSQDMFVCYSYPGKEIPWTFVVSRITAEIVINYNMYISILYFYNETSTD